MAVSVGCGGAAAPTNADANTAGTDATKAATAAAAKEDKGEATDEDGAATALPAGNKAAGAPRRATPEGTPNQQ